VAAGVGETRPSQRTAAINGVERQFDDSATGEIDAGWELDLWGRVRANVRAARADIDVARALLADTQLVTAVETARTYLQLRGLQSQQGAARRGIALQREVLQLTEVRASVGEVDNGEAAAAKAELRATEARLPQLEAEKESLLASLSVLTALPIETLRASLATDTPIPRFMPIADAGVPAEALTRRPDVRAAQATLTAADARVAAAVANQFPQIRLGLRGTSVASTFGDALSMPNFDLTRAIELRLPLFNRASIYADIEATDARRAAALAEYERILLRALADTEAALARCARFSEAQVALTEATTSGSEAVRVATARYREGDESFLTVLIAQRDQLQRELALSESQVALAVEYVSLVQNLGAF
jgi:outer membrane protein, multidrug efflux system